MNNINFSHRGKFKVTSLFSGTDSAYYALNNDSSDSDKDDYMDILINNIQTATVPKYNVSNKLVDPPIVLVSIGQ